jgi:hypothetical protein
MLGDFFYVIGNYISYYIKKRSAMVAHSHERKVSLRDRARRESFASETLYSIIGNYISYYIKKRSAMVAHSRDKNKKQEIKIDIKIFSYEPFVDLKGKVNWKNKDKLGNNNKNKKNFISNFC